MELIKQTFDYELIVEECSDRFHICLEEWYRTTIMWSDEIPNIFDILEHCVESPCIRSLIDVVIESIIIREDGVDIDEISDELYETTSIYLSDFYHMYYPKIMKDIQRFFNQKRIFHYHEEDNVQEYLSENLYNNPLEEVW